MPTRNSEQLRHMAEAQRTRYREVHLSAPDAKRFAALPSFFGMPLITRIVVTLGVNGPARHVDFLLTVSRAKIAIYNALEALKKMGIVASVSLGPRKGHAYFLNREYPAYEAIVAYGQRIARDYPTPTWDPVEVEISKQSSPLPKRPECKLFGNGNQTAALLFLYEIRGATPGQIWRALNIVQNSTKRTFAMLIELGVVTELLSLKKTVGAYVLDPRFRYGHEIRMVLGAMISIYPQYEGLARAIPLIEAPPFTKPKLQKKRRIGYSSQLKAKRA